LEFLHPDQKPPKRRLFCARVPRAFSKAIDLKERMDAIYWLLLIWCALSPSFEFDRTVKRRNVTTRIRFGFGGYTRRRAVGKEDKE
jgi:hypothetical protein